MDVIQVGEGASVAGEEEWGEKNEWRLAGRGGGTVGGLG